MAPFLGRSAFSGPSIDARDAGASFIGEARFDGVVVFTSWPREDAAQLLAPDLRLAANVSTHPELHPVVFVFGRQQQTVSLFGGVRTPTGLEYYEMAVIVPFVCHTGGTFLHSFIPRMYASDRWATWSGNVYWGFAKRMAEMDWIGRTFTVWTADDETLAAHAVVSVESDWQPCSSEPSWAPREVEELLRLPVLGRHVGGWYVTSYFEWDFTEASLRPAAAVVSVVAPLVPQLGPRSCHGLQPATFEVRRMRWRVSWPARCRF